MPTEVAEVKPGVETSEHKEVQNAKIWSTVATIMGFIITLGGTIGTALGTDSKIAIIVGAVVVCVSEVRRMLVQLGYIKSRTDVKVAKDISE